MQTNNFRRFSLISLLLAAASILTACGAGTVDGSPSGGTTTPPVQTLTGIAATGAPLASATVSVKDSLGNITSGTASATGAFSIDVSGMTPPFMLVAQKTGYKNLYSVLPSMDMTTTNTQNVNITTITTLVMFELSSGTDPSSIYMTNGFTSYTSGAVSAKEVLVRNKLPANSVNPVFNMMYGAFTATGASDSTGYDSALDALGTITGATSTTVTLSLGTTYAFGSSSGTLAGAPTITLVLRNSADTADVTSLDSSNPVKVKATVNDANGAAVSGAIVTFTTSDLRDTFSGGANTALTDALGVASVTLVTSNISGGAASVTATSVVSGLTASKTLNYSIGSSSITLSALTLLPASLSAYGTASASVQVLNNLAVYTTPMTVSFTSTCASSGKATITSSVTSSSGVAAASYVDNGCGNPSPGDLITATLMNGVTSTGYLPVLKADIGSIQFVSVVTSPVTSPPVITLKGTGGTDRSETAQVTFKIVDGAGNPIGNAPVTFSLNTSLGGLALSSTSSTSDSITGYIKTNVLAGNFSTAVRVTAKVCSDGTSTVVACASPATVLSTQSDQLLVSTGIPAQDSFSLSASTHNIEGWDYDGTETMLTARLADHFHNPVPDGTAVYFTSEGGVVEPSCTTVAGVCSVKLTSQELRPNSNLNGYGRVTVLARATGEEAFIDLNSNGTVDSGPGVGTEMIDANNISTDLGEAYVDYNEDGVHDVATEPFIDFNGDGVRNGTTTGVNGVGGTATGDGLYNGILCTSGNAICAAQKSVDVRGSQIIVFSTSHGDGSLANHFFNSLGAGITSISLTSCTTSPPSTPSVPAAVTVVIVDEHGNALPAGTTVAFSTTNGTEVEPVTFTVQDTIGCRTGFAGCPASAASTSFGNIGISLVSDATIDSTTGACTNEKSGGALNVTVTTPKGNETYYSLNVTD